MTSALGLDESTNVRRPGKGRSSGGEHEVSMTTRQGTDEAEIRQAVGRLVEATRATDLEGVKAFYAADIVSFDIVPPFRRPLGYEMRDLTITVGEDVAFGHSLNRISGTLRNGKSTDFWLHSVLPQSRRQVAHRASPAVSAHRCGKRPSVAGSRALIGTRWLAPRAGTAPGRAPDARACPILRQIGHSDGFAGWLTYSQTAV